MKAVVDAMKAFCAFGRKCCAFGYLSHNASLRRRYLTSHIGKALCAVESLSAATFGFKLPKATSAGESSLALSDIHFFDSAIFGKNLASCVTKVASNDLSPGKRPMPGMVVDAFILEPVCVDFFRSLFTTVPWRYLVLPVENGFSEKIVRSTLRNKSRITVVFPLLFEKEFPLPLALEDEIKPLFGHVEQLRIQHLLLRDVFGWL
ncbi:unnamed protein product [Clavelina lepadiformis]|uniref:Uncharacterized protein n=1 Tax=Clavelina lepadiformis TaxID=159417 RepID=A0ABP0FZH0_CLALP